jgi:hypothetical protein
MSWYLQNQVCDNADRGFYTNTEFAVMRALASFADDDGGSCYPSLLPKKNDEQQVDINEEQGTRKKSLVERSGLCGTTVKEILKTFQKRKWITIKHTGRSNDYRILPHGCVTPKPSNLRGRRTSGVHQKDAARPSEGRETSIRRTSDVPYSYQLFSSENTHQPLSFSLARERGAGAPEREKPGEDLLLSAEEERQPSNKKQDLAEEQRQPSRKRQEEPAVKRGELEADARAQCCPCGSNHPCGMPTLEEIRAEMRKFRWPDEEAFALHDAWLASGFRTNNGPIRDWKASLHNWIRWRRNGGSGVFS